MDLLSFSVRNRSGFIQSRDKTLFKHLYSIIHENLSFSMGELSG